MCRIFTRLADWWKPANTAELFATLEADRGGDGNGLWIPNHNTIQYTPPKHTDDLATNTPPKAPYVFHTRKASQGGIHERNRQPISTPKLTLAHNGDVQQLNNTFVRFLTHSATQDSDSRILATILDTLPEDEAVELALNTANLGMGSLILLHFQGSPTLHIAAGKTTYLFVTQNPSGQEEFVAHFSHDTDTEPLGPGRWETLKPDNPTLPLHATVQLETGTITLVSNAKTEPYTPPTPTPPPKPEGVTDKQWRRYQKHRAACPCSACTACRQAIFTAGPTPSRSFECITCHILISGTSYIPARLYDCIQKQHAVYEQGQGTYRPVSFYEE